MKTITLEVENPEDYQQILDFAKKLGAKITSEYQTDEKKTDIQEKLDLLKRSAGTIKNAPVIPLEALRRENLY